MIAVLRSAEPDDLTAVVEVFLACWRGSYPGVLPHAVVESMTRERAIELWSASAHRTVVALDDGDIVGVTRFGRHTDGTATVFSLYVTPKTQGGGIGRTLLSAAETGLSEPGAHQVVLWVFADNAPSLAFYRRCGWTPDGTTRVDPEWPVEQRRLTKTLRGDAP